MAGSTKTGGTLPGVRRATSRHDRARAAVESAARLPRGAEPSHRARERALATAGVDVTLVVPAAWPEGGDDPFSNEPFRILELPVNRAGDVNRHAYADHRALARLVRDVAPDVLDIHEEPFSVAARQWLAAAPRRSPGRDVHGPERRQALPAAVRPVRARRASARRGALPVQRRRLPRSRAARVRGPHRGAAARVRRLALPSRRRSRSTTTSSCSGSFGRLVPEKGVTDAVEILARVNAARPARLVVVGSGPEETAARARAAALGVADRLELVPWQSTARARRRLPRDARRARSEPADGDLGRAVRAGDRRGAGERRGRRRLRERGDPRGRGRRGDPRTASATPSRSASEWPLSPPTRTGSSAAGNAGSSSAAAERGAKSRDGRPTSTGASSPGNGRESPSAVSARAPSRRARGVRAAGIDACGRPALRPAAPAEGRTAGKRPRAHPGRCGRDPSPCTGDEQMDGPATPNKAR